MDKRTERRVRHPDQLFDGFRSAIVQLELLEFFRLVAEAEEFSGDSPWVAKVADRLRSNQSIVQRVIGFRPKGTAMQNLVMLFRSFRLSVKKCRIRSQFVWALEPESRSLLRKIVALPDDRQIEIFYRLFTPLNLRREYFSDRL